MVEVVFRYHDEASHGEWRELTLQVANIEEDIHIYCGLDGDPILHKCKIVTVEPTSEVKK